MAFEEILKKIAKALNSYTRNNREEIFNKYMNSDEIGEEEEFYYKEVDLEKENFTIKFKKGEKMEIKEVFQLKNSNLEKFFKQESDSIDRIRLFDLDDNDRIIVKFSDGEELRIKYKELRRALNNESKDLYKKYKNLDRFMELSGKDVDFVKDLKEHEFFSNFSFPELIDFKDITDEEFNEFEPIEKVTLKSEGLWIGNGRRYIKLFFNQIVEDILKFDRKSTISLFFNKKNNEDIDRLEFAINKRSLVLTLDTDKFLDFFEKDEKEALFSGYITLDFEIGDDSKYKFFIYFEIKMINPLFFINKSNVGVDFGTSSTCVAIDKGRKLIAFTDNPKGIEDYENATSIIIFNWKKIYQEWVNKNITIPFFKRSDSNRHAEDVDYKKEHYNYSNYIKKELKEAPNAKTIDAIISEIKLLPQELEEDRKNKRAFIPFDKLEFKKRVQLTDDIEEENEETLNPIALYGYLVGKSLNLQIKNELYVNYLLTMPVKFSQSQKEAILKSLGEGIKRSLPIWVREKVRVMESYPESVALLGAAKKLKHFKLKDIEEDAYPFAVFDFGGGTLDFAFGIYRKPVKDERAIFDNENRYRDIIEIFKIDGMNLGGEKIIDRLSYEIYIMNKEEMKENKIPIFVPEEEEKIYNYPENLLSKSHIARLNLKNISEKISREFFISGDVPDEISVELFSITDEDIASEYNLKILKEELEAKLDEIIYDAVENFRFILESVFKEFEYRLKEFNHKSFDINKVKIFQAGNASRNRNVKKAFEEVFKGHQKENIVFLESDDEDEMKKITPKNAVARGVLFLENNGYYYYQASEKEALDRYIWFIEDIEEEGDEAVAKLKKGDTENKDFEIISRVDNTQFSVYFSDVAFIEDEDDERLKHIDVNLPDELVDDDLYFVYAKPYYGKFLEIRLGDEDEIKTDSYILDLEKAELKKLN